MKRFTSLSTLVLGCMIQPSAGDEDEYWPQTDPLALGANMLGRYYEVPSGFQWVSHPEDFKHIHKVSRNLHAERGTYTNKTESYHFQELSRVLWLDLEVYNVEEQCFLLIFGCRFVFAVRELVSVHVSRAGSIPLRKFLKRMHGLSAKPVSPCRMPDLTLSSYRVKPRTVILGRLSLLINYTTQSKSQASQQTKHSSIAIPLALDNSICDVIYRFVPYHQSPPDLNSFFKLLEPHPIWVTEGSR